MKGIKDVVAYVTADGKLFANAEMAAIHAELLAVRLNEIKAELKLMVEDQRRDKRELKHKLGWEAAELQSRVANRSAKITAGMDFVKKRSAR